MKKNIPLGLKIVRVLVFIWLALLLFALVTVGSAILDPRLFIYSIVALVFYVSLIMAINKAKRKLLILTCVSLIVLMAIEIALYIMMSKAPVGFQNLIGVILLGYLWKKRDYFSE